MALTYKKAPFGSSPRPWRCFHVHAIRLPVDQVFSTSVEVFLFRLLVLALMLRLLHVRGGVSILGNDIHAPWAVFSTSVEVFLSRLSRIFFCTSLLHVRGGVSLNPLKVWSTRGLLHVRGGVSFNCAYCSQKSLSSPRPWRCF